VDIPLRQQPASEPALCARQLHRPHRRASHRRLAVLHGGASYSLLTPPSSPPLHAYLTDRTDGTVHGEDEFLFAPYSCFTVRAVHWEESPIVDDFDMLPHRIEVDVAPDNQRMPKELPLAPWC
jgi:hypothetical protein